LILYVESAEAIGMDSVEVLSFLFLLSSLEHKSEPVFRNVDTIASNLN
jgi:transcription initiation factor TFIIH subunit 4